MVELANIAFATLYLPLKVGAVGPNAAATTYILMVTSTHMLSARLTILLAFLK